MNSSYNQHQNPLNSSSFFLPNQTTSRTTLDDWFLEIQEIKRAVEIACVSLLAVVSLFGNTSLLAIFIKYKEMRTSTNLFIINMVISDLLYVIFVIPNVLHQPISLSEEWMFGGAFGVITCKLGYFIRDMSFTVSITSMVTIALDRFYAVVYPIRRQPRYLNPRFSIPFIWLISSGSFAIYFYTARLVSHPVLENTYYCLSIWTPAFDQIKSPSRLYLFLVVAFFMVPLVVITVSYSIIIYKLRNHSIPGVRTSESEKLQRKRNRSITKVGVLIVLCFFFSWAPYHCLNLILEYHWNFAPPLHLLESIDWLHFAFTNISMTSIATNAFVCYACSSRFRNCLKKLVSCCPSPSSVREERQTVTRSSHLQGTDESKTIGVINKGMSTEQAIELENEWDTKL
ncbi:prolactin-releasing peptide receptor-like [Actinia tenebrosa]|uniref:Prolactin-releasing peptide receptor-like n=1 Tax=Actinia tenebrosa TaxID=6105 RepID=A0A6P8GZ21_ACTTE|nr:prolactin-releasing peptide receptor-like [Actinia tenebrosa]